MILSNDEILELIDHPRNSEAIEDAIELQDDHKVHVNGLNYQNVINRILDYEDQKQFVQKRELSEPVTPILTKKIKDEQGRWKTVNAKKYYEWKGIQKDKEFREEILSGVWKGESIDYFIKQFFSEALYTEFNGFVIVERPQTYQEGDIWYEIKDGIKSPSKGEPNPYLIFRPIENILDFVSRGNRVEYLMIDWGEEIRKEKGGDIKYRLIRVIDDEKDVIYESAEETLVANKDMELQSGYQESRRYPRIKNKLGYVPAIQISTYRRDIKYDEIKTSPIGHIIPHLKTYLTLWAEHVITCILHSHPIYYQIGQKCTYEDSRGKCEDGIIRYTTPDGQPKEVTCPACKGAGAKIRKNASQALILPQLDEEGNAYNVSNVAGYVTPPVEALQQQIKELNWLKEDIFLAGTGMNKMAETEIEKTATEAILNYKPLEKIVSEIQDNLEYVETFLVDTIGKMRYGSKYVRSEISYSRTLNLRDENTILTEIEQAKNSGASASYVRTLHRELIQTRYHHNKIDLERNMMLEEMEPFIGYTPEELNKYYSGFIDQDTMLYKVYFTDYIVRFENEIGLITDYKPDKDMRERVNMIKDKLLSYNQEKKQLIADQVTQGNTQSSGDEA